MQSRDPSLGIAGIKTIRFYEFAIRTKIATEMQ